MATKQEVADYINANVASTLTEEEIAKVDEKMNPEVATILIITSAPSVAKRRAISLPIPRPAPVITALFPFSCIKLFPILNCLTLLTY